jgi:hypothetical protein
MNAIYRQNGRSLAYQEIQERIIREGYAAGMIYAFCIDGTAYLGSMQDGQERFSPVDKKTLEAIVKYGADLSESAAVSAAHLAAMRDGAGKSRARYLRG